MADKVTMRAPCAEDFTEALYALAGLHGALPACLSAAVLFLLTGDIVASVLGALVTSYTHLFFARLSREAPCAG